MTWNICLFMEYSMKSWKMVLKKACGKFEQCTILLLINPEDDEDNEDYEKKFGVIAISLVKEK